MPSAPRDRERGSHPAPLSSETAKDIGTNHNRHTSKLRRFFKRSLSVKKFGWVYEPKVEIILTVLENFVFLNM